MTTRHSGRRPATLRLANCPLGNRSQLTFRGCGDNRRCRVRARRLGSRSGDDARLRRHDDQCHTDAAARRGGNGEGSTSGPSGVSSCIHGLDFGGAGVRTVRSRMSSLKVPDCLRGVDAKSLTCCVTVTRRPRRAWSRGCRWVR
jgi:hypothetical protein